MKAHLIRIMILALFSGQPLAAQETLIGTGVAAPQVDAGEPVQQAADQSDPDAPDRPKARPVQLPRTQWQHRPKHALWTRAALAALKGHGQPLVEALPSDIGAWCPAYAERGSADRRAFWVGFLSTLARYESTHRATAVGGGGRWFGLVQISPGTARGYGCRARSGAALKDGAANLSCAIRIMAETVTRDGVIHGYRNGQGQGVTADWGPMHSARKRAEMAGWLKRQSYCKPLGGTRPRARP